MQNGSGRIGASQWRQFCVRGVAQQFGVSVDFYILNWSAAHDNVRLDNVISEDDTQFFVVLDRSPDIVQVLILLIVTNVSTKRELPVARAQVMQDFESTR